MVCSSCGQYFCYRCNKAIDGYDRFRDGTCELFTQQMIREWEECLNPRQALGQARAQLFGEQGQGQICPNCRQFNARWAIMIIYSAGRAKSTFVTCARRL